MNRIVLPVLLVFGLLGPVFSMAQNADDLTEPQVADSSVVEPSIVESEHFDIHVEMEGHDEAAVIVDEIIHELVNSLHEEWESLDPDERQEVKDSLKEAFSHGIKIDTGTMGAFDMITAIVAITFTLGLPVLILLMIFIFAHRKRRQRMELIQSFLDAGQPVPDQIMEEHTGVQRGDLYAGIRLTGIGLGITLALGMLGGIEAAAIGVIPLCIGLARVVYWKMQQQKEQQEEHGHSGSGADSDNDQDSDNEALKS